MFIVTKQQYKNMLKDAIKVAIYEIRVEDSEKRPAEEQKKKPPLKGPGEYDEYCDVLKEYDKEGSIKAYLKDKTDGFAESVRLDIKEDMKKVKEYMKTAEQTVSKMAKEGMQMVDGYFHEMDKVRAAKKEDNK